MEQGCYTIDRFEDVYAVLEDDNLNYHNVLREHLPEEALEGNHLIFDGEVFIIDIQMTQESKMRIKSKFDMLKKRADNLD